MKIVVFYYTQTGQALNVARNLCAPLGNDSCDNVVYKQIMPIESYPFPWDKDTFFDTFPETRLGITPSGIKPIDFSDIKDADIVIVVGQSWYLSPSMPIQSFFGDKEVQEYLNGRNVIFVNACRNMWLNTKAKVKAFIENAGARMVGHIVLRDKANNLIGVLTVIRWLIHGQKEASKRLPAAGISNEDIKTSCKFGEIIKTTLKKGDIDSLQSKLLQAGAIEYEPFVMYVERVGHRMFGFWARFIRRKGGWRDPRRLFRVKMFYIYLLAVLFIVSPLAQIFFYLTYPLQRVGYHKKQDCNL